MRQFIIIIAVCFAILPLAAQPEHNIENGAVKAFLADRTYETNSDYSQTVVTKYNSSTYYSGSRHRPVPVTISWTLSATPQSQTIVVSTNEDFSNSLTFTASAAATSVDIYNLVPGQMYYYKVIGHMSNGTQTIEADNAFTVAGPVRMIYVDGVNNVRDLGGWQTSLKKPVLYGRVYRGANLDNITAAGRAEFHDRLGVRAELDLRRADETVITSSPLGSDVNYMRLSTTEYYNGMANQPTTLIEDFKFIIANLRQGRPTMFHCLIGADRTGTLAFMQEGVLGVGETDLCRDYELTTFSVTGDRLRSSLADMVKYVKTFSGSNLQQKFYNYLLSKGMTHEELDDYIAIMLDNYTLPTRIATAADQYLLHMGDTVSLMPQFYPVDYAPAVVYATSDEQVAEVTADGRVIAHAAGQAVVTVSVGFHSEIYTQVVVNVQSGEESAVPAQVAMPSGSGINIYNVVGENLVANGSFEYQSATALWTDVNNEQLGAANFAAPAVDAPYGGRYLQSLANGDALSPASIVRSVPVEAGKTYVVGYCIKNTGGTAVVSNPDIKLILKSGSTAQGTTDDFDNKPIDGQGGDDNKPGGTVDDFIIGSNAYVSSVGPEPQTLDFHPSYGGEWTAQTYVFTVPDNYSWCEMQFAELGSHGGATCLDNVYVAEARKAGTISSAKRYLQEVVGSVVLTNYGDEPLQYPAAKARLVEEAFAKAEALLSLNPTAQQVAQAVNEVRLALADYLSAPLNSPDPQQCYLIQSGDKVLTPYDNLTADLALAADDNLDQGFRFLYTMESDIYIIEHPLNDGTSLYLTSDGKTLALTPRIGEATRFKILPTNQQGQTVLSVADGKQLFNFSIAPDYGILNEVSATTTDSPAATSVAIYTLSGQCVQSAHSGIYIVRYSDGTTRIEKVK